MRMRPSLASIRGSIAAPSIIGVCGCIQLGNVPLAVQNPELVVFHLLYMNAFGSGCMK